MSRLALVLIYIGSDATEEEKAQGLQAEHERMLAFQQKTNQKLRDLELANEEKAGLLRAALLDRDNLSPELLALKRDETIRYMRERIDAVIKAPSEVQPKVLDTTSFEIAETVLSAEAALDKAKNVSIKQFSNHTDTPSSAFQSVIHSIRSKQQRDPEFTEATLVSPSTRKNKSISEMSMSTNGTGLGQNTWGRMTQMLSPKSTRESLRVAPLSSTSMRTIDERVASLSLTAVSKVYLDNIPCLTFIIFSAPLQFDLEELSTDNVHRTCKNTLRLIPRSGSSLRKPRWRAQKRAR